MDYIGPLNKTQKLILEGVLYVLVHVLRIATFWWGEENFDRNCADKFFRIKTFSLPYIRVQRVFCRVRENTFRMKLKNPISKCPEEPIEGGFFQKLRRNVVFLTLNKKFADDIHQKSF